MKALISCKETGELHFADCGGALGLFTSIPESVIIEHEAPLCKLNSGGEVKIVFTLKDPGGLRLRKPLRLTDDAFFAVQVFRVKQGLTILALSYDKDHTSERDFIFQTLGMIEPIFVEGL